MCKVDRKTIKVEIYIICSCVFSDFFFFNTWVEGLGEWWWNQKSEGLCDPTVIWLIIRNREKCSFIEGKKLDKVQATQRLVKSNLNLEFFGYVLVTLLRIFSFQNIILIIMVVIMVIIITPENLGWNVWLSTPKYSTVISQL